MRTTPLPPSTAPRPTGRRRPCRPATCSSTASTSSGSISTPICVTDEAVVLGDRLDDRRAGGLYVEVLQAQVVAQNARDPALEGVELGKRILADGEEEVHPQVRAVDDRGEVDREGTRALLAAVVDEVLLGLVEDHVEVAVQDLLPHPKGVHERAPPSGGRSDAPSATVTASATARRSAARGRRATRRRRRLRGQARRARRGSSRRGGEGGAPRRPGERSSSRPRSRRRGR